MRKKEMCKKEIYSFLWKREIFSYCD